MAVDPSLEVSESDLNFEIKQLRQDLLTTLLPAAAIIGWAWWTYAVIRAWSPGTGGGPALLFSVVAYLAYRLRERHYTLACWVFLLGLILGESIIVAGPAGTSAIAFGVLIIIAAHVLLGTWEAVAILICTWLAVFLARYRGMQAAFFDLMRTADMFLLYASTLGITWVAARPLRSSLGWALTGWGHAREALQEVKQRRGELYRILRALEEATYRIERMNNELLVAQREATEAQALKSRFVATISHEIRNPLNLILGFSRMMALFPERYGEPLPASYHADVDIIYRNSQHLLALVDDVLELSQIEAQSLPLVKDRLDLQQEVVERTIAIVQPLADRKGLFLRYEPAGELPWVFADPVRLRQALMNLLTNAIRLTERGGITLRTVQREADILVSVQDTGPGIPPDELPRLFKEFHRVHLTETREQGGTGLGLSICKHLVELHGGQIWVESQLGQGTTFHFTVPLPGQQAVPAAYVSTGSAGLPTPGSKICLVVHGDLAVIRLLARYVEGYRVVGTADVGQVVTLVEQLHPRAILVDRGLCQGIERELSATGLQVPVISCGLPRLGIQGEASRFAGYLVKPITPEMVRAVMEKVTREVETTVLLVDDDPDAVQLLEAMLMAIPRPYRILRAYDGAQALEIMQEQVPDVVLIDLLMPGLSGEQAIAQMQADERLRDVPVVIVSGRDWTDGAATLELPLCVSHGKDLDVPAAARCLQVLMEEISPSYLPEPAHGQPS